MDEQKAYQELKKKLSNRWYRLNHLYYIKNKQGLIVLLKLNISQRLLYFGLWFLNIVLKARQRGISTFFEVFILDYCLFNGNSEAGIIDYTLPDAKKKLKIIRLAYEHLPDWLKNEIKLIKDNEQEIEFSNGSRITADTTFRGSTVQLLHISEYGKICKVDPIRAAEIKSGALNAVAKGQFVFIESTAEDSEGDFFDKVDKAEKLQLAGTTLTEMDYKFFFLPWWEDTGYQLEKPVEFVFSTESARYFKSLEDLGIELTENQKFWYVKKKEEQGDDMKKEYPSTSKEAFESVTEDKYYKELMLIAKSQHRITEWTPDMAIKVDLDLDLGLDDYTTVIFSQRIGKEIQIVDYLEVNQVQPEVIARLIKDKGYFIGTMFLPHDARQTRLGMPKDLYHQFSDYFHCDVALPTGIIEGISEVRRLFNRFWFRRSTTGVLREHLEHYGKKWSEAMGKFMGPNHNEHSHAADGLRGLAMRYKEIEKQNNSGYTKREVPINSLTGF